jgi:CheY-like chemotaxis protein
MINKVLRSGERAADLMNQLQAFSRKQMIEPQVLNLNVVIADMDKMLRRISGEDINLKTIPAQELWPVKVDPTQMDQIILNLAVNACEAMPDAGQLTIETANVIIDDDYAAGHFGAQPGEYVLLAISDTSRGMSHEVQSHLFEPFFTTKEASKGRGLGLAAVYGIVKQNGGHIGVQSEENRGTVFKIYLPRAVESKYSFPSIRIGEKTTAGHETVLLVEDTTLVRDLVRRILQKQGYILLEAQNGEEALQLITNYAGPIHLLLTDIVMPGISGKTLAEEAAHLRPDMKVLYISGYAGESFTDHDAVEPGDAFLQKPFNPTALARKVRAVLDT